MEPSCWQRAELVLVIDLVDRNSSIHLKAVQEKEQLRQFLRLQVMPLLAVTQLQLQMLDSSQQVDLAVSDQICGLHFFGLDYRFLNRELRVEADDFGCLDVFHRFRD
jgi:hypothetical protein